MSARKDRKLELLKKVSLFTPCSDRELKRIGALVDTVDIAEGNVLTKEGDPGREFFVISKGKAKVTLKGRKLAELGSGDFFGEMSLLDRGPRAATVTATTPMTLYVLAAPSFAKFLEEAPTVSRKLMKGLAERLREVEKSLKYQH